mmetsp:Transcript_27468/g.36010  ORF Transcript_27468/g.36010 Transcript_27468/m.36010 type:complete len:254 (-) Transcript_27468:139-900(-)|eukprot:CAMPEP_0117754242 /NCGR_PEP_ID=MMETSP0947-20121206/12716_1 /TAXON_ID=44440 /ORGANISM="Chattonella subsalsa, Strain CCMP2191" /LENGTH=253 /DNA_ID=CAMNT_0005573301 /DNA_START=58 /DNA_END=819 /DNA_ORIENTATION=-
MPKFLLTASLLFLLFPANLGLLLNDFSPKIQKVARLNHLVETQNAIGDPYLISSIVSSDHIAETTYSISPKLTSITTAFPFGNDDISTAVAVCTFFPQPFFLLMIFAPTWNVTEKVMKPWLVPICSMLIHLFIVVVSASQQDGTAPIGEFSDVFDPSGNPLAGMQGMMQYPNFVAEEWSHVLAWDLFVGRWIWMDGLKRGIFTPHSVLLTNLIGPPGFLLHAVTCALTGKGLPSTVNLDGNNEEQTTGEKRRE